MSDQLQRAIINAHNAKDYAAAKRLGQLLKQQQSTQSSAQLQAAPGQYQSPLPDPFANRAAPKDSALDYSVDQGQKLVGKGIEAAGRVFNSKGISDYGSQVVQQQEQDIAQGGYQPQYTQSLRETYNQGGLGPALGWAAEKTAENAASGGAALAGAGLAALTAPVSMPLAAIIGGATTAGSVLMGAGEAAFEQEEKTGSYDEKVAVGVGTIIGFLDKFGAGKVIPKDRLARMTADEITGELSKKGFGNAAKEFAKRTGIEAATETAQEGLSVAAAAAKGGQYTAEELGDRALESAVLGGTTSATAQAGMGSLSAARNLVPTVKDSSPEDLDAAASFAQRLAEIADANSWDLQDVDKMADGGARATVDLAHVQYTEELKRLFADMKSRVKVTDKDNLQEVADKILAEAGYREGRNKTKNTVGKQEMDAIERLAGDTYEGRQALSILRQLNQLTAVHNGGYQGGVSKITDQFSPWGSTVGYDKGAAATERILRPIVSGSAAIGSGGASLAAQIAAQKAGRMIDRVTGRRSVVDRYVRQNQGRQGIPEPTEESLRMQNLAELEAEEARQQAQEEAIAATRARQAAEGYPVSGNSPLGTAELVLDTNASEIIKMAEILAENHPDSFIRQSASELIASAQSNVESVTGLKEIIAELKRMINPDADFWRQREAQLQGVGPAQAAQARKTQAEINYERGVQDNINFNTQLVDALNADTSVEPLAKAVIHNALGELKRDLGANPVDMVSSIVERAVEKGATPEQVQQYLMPYVERVQQQQAAKAQRDAARDDADPIKEARVVPVPFGKPGMQRAFGVSNPTEGGNYIDLDTKDDLTGNTYQGGSVKIIDGRPVMETSDVPAEPATKESGNKVKVNLFKKKAGWSWIDYDGPDTIVSTEQGGKHYYSLSSDFQTPVTLKTYPKQPSEPRLRPTSQGKIVLGEKIGSISVRGKVHPVYDQVTVEDKRATDPIKESREVSLPTRDGKKHGIDRIYTVDTEGPVRGKSAFVKTLNVKNYPVVNQAMQELSDRHDDALSTPDAWLAFERDLMGDNETPAAPTGLIDLINDVDKWAARHGQLSGDQLSAAQRGFEVVEGMKQIYADGTATVDTTGKLMAWGIMSRMLSAVNQEAGFVDAVMDGKMSDFIARAVERPFTAADVKEYKKWVASVIPKGSFGKPGTSNLNSFGDTFLKKMSVKQPDGRSGLEHLHDMISDPDVSSAQIRRAFYGLADGVGIANKVLSFMLLMMGRTDVVVLDRIQINSMWDASKYGKLIYDDVADLFSGPQGLARYEALEKGLLTRIDALYEKLGRPQDASVGRYHWESWVRDSGQVVAHPTMEGVYDESVTGDTLNAYADLGAPEGRMHRYSYGAIYARDTEGNPYISYADSSGEPYIFSLDSWPKFQKQIQKAKAGVVPKGFKVSDYKQGYPWYEAEGVNREKLDEQIKSFGKRASSSKSILQGDAGQRDANVTGQPQAQEEQVNPSIDPSKGVLQAAVAETFRQPTPAQIKDKLEPAKKLQKFIIGKAGSPFENGISTYDDLVQLADMLDVSVAVVTSDQMSSFETKGQFQSMLGGTAGEIKLRSPYVLGNLNFMTTLAHEVSHALEGLTLSRIRESSDYVRNAHPKSDGSSDIMREGSFRARLNNVIELATATPGMFVKRKFDDVPSREVAQKIVAEIDSLQDGTLIGIADKPELGTMPIRPNFDQYQRMSVEGSFKPLPDTASALEIASREAEIEQMRSQDYVQEITNKGFNQFVTYTKETAEFGVDPLHFYLLDPKGMKKMMPETFKFMRNIFNKSSMPIEMHSNPMVAVIALLMAGFGKALTSGEEEEQPQGVLTPPPAVLTA